MGKRAKCLARLFGLALLVPNLRAQPPPVDLHPDAPTYARHGPHWVDIRELVIPDAEGGRTLPATVWPPALNPKGVDEATPLSRTATHAGGETAIISGRGIRDAPIDPAGAPCRLVIHSHGARGARLLWPHHQARLASRGFVVLGMDHGRKQTHRPRDVQRAPDLATSLNTAGGAGLAGMIPGGFKDSRIKSILPLAPSVGLTSWDSAIRILHGRTSGSSTGTAPSISSTTSPPPSRWMCPGATRRPTRSRCRGR